MQHQEQPITPLKKLANSAVRIATNLVFWVILTVVSISVLARAGVYIQSHAGNTDIEINKEQNGNTITVSFDAQNLASSYVELILVDLKPGYVVKPKKGSEKKILFSQIHTNNPIQWKANCNGTLFSGNTKFTKAIYNMRMNEGFVRLFYTNRKHTKCTGTATLTNEQLSLANIKTIRTAKRYHLFFDHSIPEERYAAVTLRAAVYASLMMHSYKGGIPFSFIAIIILLIAYNKIRIHHKRQSVKGKNK